MALLEKKKARVQTQGRITIPAEARETLGWAPDTEIAFEVEGETLRVRKVSSAREGVKPSATASPLQKEAFIGLWKDREDLKDSAAWVRRVREGEWGID
jgi:AbrB family looped-hinge helix DNA binding protein